MKFTVTTAALIAGLTALFVVGVVADVNGATNSHVTLPFAGGVRVAARQGTQFVPSATTQMARIVLTTIPYTMPANGQITAYSQNFGVYPTAQASRITITHPGTKLNVIYMFDAYASPPLVVYKGDVLTYGSYTAPVVVNIYI